MSFGVQVARWTSKTKAGMEAWVRGTVLDLAQELIITTPIGMPELWVRRYAPPGYRPGTLRAGWRYSTGAPAPGLPEAPDASGEATLTAIAASLPTRMGGKIHYLSNNVPYFPLIEYLGYSTQAPGGVIGPTVLKFQAIAAKNKVALAGGEL